MATLNQFLSRFSTATIQRSMSYVKKIDLKSLEIYPDRDNLVIEAQVQGTDYYETAVIFNPLKNKIVDTDCSCSVGIDCKHAAALARYFYDQQGSHPSTAQTLNHSDQTQATKNSPTLGTAKVWLDQFRIQLQQIKQAETVPNNQLIYIFQPKNDSTKLQLSVFKTRRNKDGKIRDTTLYTSYDNVLNEKLKVSQQEKKIFSSLYFFAKMNFSDVHFYPMSWDISGIYQEHLKTAIQMGEIYCIDIIRPPLTWSEDTYKIEFNWQSRPEEKTEKLKAQFYDQNDFEISVEHAKEIFIIHSHPPSYLDISKNQIGALDSAYSSEMIDELMNMPQMPVELLAEFEQVIQPYPIFENLPQAQFAQNIETLTGKPTPILRFGTHPQYDRLGHMHHYAIAEIEFEYPAGRIKAGFTEDNFIINVDEKTIKQQRDLTAEKTYINVVPLIRPLNSVL